MTALALCPTHNRKGKRDVTGAFLPEARAWCELHGGELGRFDDRRSRPRVRRQVEAAIRAARGLQLLGIFCHGYRRGLQTKHTTHSIGNLADAIADVASENGLRIGLYACDTGRDGDNQRADDRQMGPGGEGGFADALRDALLERGLRGGWIDAHAISGHTTRTPFKRRFYLEPDAAPFGGDWIVAPGSPVWREWRRRLRSDRAYRLGGILNPAWGKALARAA